MLADSNSEITMQPQPTEKEIQFILEAIAEYLTVKVCFPATQAALQCINLIPTCSCYVLCPGQRFFYNRLCCRDNLHEVSKFTSFCLSLFSQA